MSLRTSALRRETRRRDGRRSSVFPDLVTFLGDVRHAVNGLDQCPELSERYSSTSLLSLTATVP